VSRLHPPSRQHRRLYTTVSDKVIDLITKKLSKNIRLFKPPVKLSIFQTQNFS
jgi:hypothetical protein